MNQKPIPYLFSFGFKDGLLAVRRQKGTLFVDKYGEIIADLKFDAVYDFTEGLALAKKGDHKVFINKSGNEVLNMDKYLEVDSFSDGLCGVCDENGKWGFINKEGHLVIPFLYDDVMWFSEGYCSVGIDSKYGVIDREGNTVCPFIYDDIIVFSEGLAEANKDGKYGNINPQGDVVVPIIYQSTGECHEGLICASNDEEKCGVLDRTGKEVVSFIYDDMDYFFSENLLMVKKDGKAGFINSIGELAIPFEYDEARTFTEGLAAVRLGKLWGYIDKDNNIKIPFEYERAETFCDGLAFVKGKGRNAYYIDKNNEVNIWLRKEYTMIEKLKIVVFLGVILAGILMLIGSLLN